MQGFLFVSLFLILLVMNDEYLNRGGFAAPIMFSLYGATTSTAFAISPTPLALKPKAVM
jgi:hypothetical protein